MERYFPCKMLKCKKCSGRVFIDRVFSQKSHIELFCILCGKRWMLDKERTVLGRWLLEKETAQAKSLSISI